MNEPHTHQERAIIDDAVTSSKNRKGRLFVTLAVLSVVLFAALASVSSFVAYRAVQNSAQQGVSLATQVQTACDDPTVDKSDLGTLCDDADKVVEEAPAAAKGEKGEQGIAGEPGEDGDPGVPGQPGPPPSPAQVSNAVASYCAVNRCRGRDGVDGTNGADGENATPAQVANAVAAYCNDQGQCRGPEGESGSDGQDGAAGKDGQNGQNGETGPPPSDVQVASAVSAYCSTRNNCQGTPGEAGPQGDAGQPGSVGPAGPAGTPGSVLSSGSCDFTGVGTITITLNTSTGPVTVSCQGNPGGITP